MTERKPKHVLLTEYDPDILDHKRIADFLGNWKTQHGNQGMEFIYPKIQDSIVEMHLQISRKFVRLSACTNDGKIVFDIVRPDVKTVRILDENTDYELDKVSNPRLAVFTDSSNIFLYRDDLDFFEITKGKIGDTESRIPLGLIADAINL